VRLPLGLALVALGVAVLAPAGNGQSRSAPATLGPHGIGTARFGETERATVSGLTALLGPPTRRLPNTGCGPRFREVAWGHLYAEFRSGRFEGFRYVVKGWPLDHTGGTTPVSPKARTPKGVTLGDTLGEVRAAYGSLRLVGTDRWESSDGLVFYDNAKHDPVPPSSRIVEIKIGTCGDF